MNNSASKVIEIFREADAAFNKLAEMMQLLNPMGDSQPGGKTDGEVEMLRTCVHRFAVDLNSLSQYIKGRIANQIRISVKKQDFEDACVPVRQVTLNASEKEVDVVGLNDVVKLESESTNEEAASNTKLGKSTLDSGDAE